MIHKNFKLLLIGLLFFSGTLFAGSSGFQIAPPPIAYPYFEEGKVDLKFEPMLISIESAEADLSLSGIGFNFIRRQAFSDMLAFDMQGSMSVLTGQMPGVAMYYSYDYYATPTGKADVTMTAMSFSFNLEMQLVKEGEESLIFFFGPNFGLANMTMLTPYSLTVLPPHSNAGQVFSGYTDTTTILSSTVGLQFGMQANLSLGDRVSISPFFMMSSTSATATITNDPGTSDTEPTTFTGDPTTSTATSFGMDIIIDEISIGTILQNISQEDESDVNIVMFRFGYHF